MSKKEIELPKIKLTPLEKQWGLLIVLTLLQLLGVSLPSYIVAVIAIIKWEPK